MPDKHEVGGSSPLGPTREQWKRIPLKTKRSLVLQSSKSESSARYKFLKWFESTWAYQKVKINYEPFRLNGGVAQLGEHLPCKQGVMGSNPIISTIGIQMDSERREDSV